MIAASPAHIECVHRRSRSHLRCKCECWHVFTLTNNALLEVVIKFNLIDCPLHALGFTVLILSCNVKDVQT